MKLKVKPKKFSKDIKSDNSSGQKRKAKDADDHRKKQFKAKKWKGEKKTDENENGKSDPKGFKKTNKESKSRSKNRKFDSSKTRKRKFHDDGGSKDFAKKKKSSEVGEGKIQK